MVYTEEQVEYLENMFNKSRNSYFISGLTVGIFTGIFLGMTIWFTTYEKVYDIRINEALEMKNKYYKLYKSKVVRKEKHWVEKIK